MRRPPVAGRCSPPHGAAAGCRSSGFDRRANLSNCILADLRSAGSHCENSGSSDGSGASARSDRVKSEVFRDRSASAGGDTRYFSRCLIFWCFWIKPKAQKKNFERRKIFRSILREASRPSIRRFLRGADLPPFVTKRWRQKCPPGGKRRGTAVGLRLKRYADKLAPAFSPAHPPPVLLPAFSQGGSCGALRATIKRMSPFIVCAARNHDHLVAFRFGRPAIFRRDGGCLPGQVKTHPLFRIGCAERGAILPVRVPEVVKTIYFLKKRGRLFFNSQNYSIFALDFAE